MIKAREREDSGLAALNEKDEGSMKLKHRKEAKLCTTQCYFIFTNSSCALKLSEDKCLLSHCAFVFPSLSRYPIHTRGNVEGWKEMKSSTSNFPQQRLFLTIKKMKWKKRERERKHDREEGSELFSEERAKLFITQWYEHIKLNEIKM